MPSNNQIPPATILIVEDNQMDYETILRAFKKLDIRNPVYRCATGEEALDFLYHRGQYADAQNSPRPNIILLDLNLPGTDGRDILKDVKKDPKVKSIPIIILTTSNSSKDIEECYGKGANIYMKKAPDWENFLREMDSFKNYCLETIELPNGRLRENS